MVGLGVGPRLQRRELGAGVADPPPVGRSMSDEAMQDLAAEHAARDAGGAGAAKRGLIGAGAADRAGGAAIVAGILDDDGAAEDGARDGRRWPVARMSANWVAASPTAPVAVRRRRRR